MGTLNASNAEKTPFLFGHKLAPNLLCTLIVATRTVSVTCTLASLYHLFVVSEERYLAIKHSLAYETGLETEARSMIASGVSWAGALIILPIDFISEANRQFMSALTVFVTHVFIPAMIYFHVTVYREVRRNTKQIIATQVSLKAKAKLLKNRKSFYTTTIILFAIVVCYIPGNVWIVIVAASKRTIPVNNVRHVVFNATSSLLVLNSLLNPLIYAVWIRCFRVAFIQLLSRKTHSKAQELEKRIFGSRRSGAGAITNITNQQKNKANGDDEVKEATLDNVQETQFNEHNSGPVQQRVGNQVSMLWIINFQFLKRRVFLLYKNRQEKLLFKR